MQHYRSTKSFKRVSDLQYPSVASRGSGRISEEPSRAALGPLSCGRCVAVMYSKVGESSQREARRELPQRPPPLPSPASPSHHHHQRQSHGLAAAGGGGVQTGRKYQISWQGGVG